MDIRGVLPTEEWVRVMTRTNRARDILGHPDSWKALTERDNSTTSLRAARTLALLTLGVHEFFENVARVFAGCDHRKSLMRIAELFDPTCRNGIVREIRHYCKRELKIFREDSPFEYAIFDPVAQINLVFKVLDEIHCGDAYWAAQSAFNDLAAPLHWISINASWGLQRSRQYMRLRTYLEVFQSKMAALSREVYLKSRDLDPCTTAPLSPIARELFMNKTPPPVPGSRLDNHRRLAASIEDFLEDFRRQRRILLLERNEPLCHPSLQQIAEWINSFRADKFPVPVTRKMVETAMENALGRTINEVKAIVHNRDVRQSETYRSKKEKLNGNPEYFSPAICVYWVGLLNEKFVLSDKPTNWKKAFQNLNTIEAVLDAVNNTPSLD